MLNDEYRPKRWLGVVGVLCAVTSLSFVIWALASKPSLEAGASVASSEAGELLSPKVAATDSPRTGVLLGSNWDEASHPEASRSDDSPRYTGALSAYGRDKVNRRVFEKLEGTTVGIAKKKEATGEDVREMKKLYESQLSGGERR